MPAGTLEVMVQEAKGIKDTEIFGKSDPYAVLTCGQKKLRTSTAQDQGSHPVWNQKLVFHIVEGTYQLTVRIYNENVLQDDEIGSAVIPLAKVFSDCKVPSTAYNVIRPSGRTQGTVKLELNFTPKDSSEKISAAPGGAFSHEAAYPHVPYGRNDSYGIQPSTHGDVQQPMGAYSPHNYSFHHSNSSPSSQNPGPSPMPQSSQHSQPSPFPGYPPPISMPSAYPPSSYPPVPHPYNSQQSHLSGSSNYPTAENTYPRPPSQFGGNTDQYKGNMMHGSYPGPPHPTQLESDIPVKRMEELSLGKKPSNNKDSMTFYSPPYPSTEYGFSGEQNSKAKPGESYPPYGYLGAGESHAGGYPQAVYPAAGVYSEPEKPSREKKQNNIDGFQTGDRQASYPPAGYSRAVTVDEYGKPGKVEKQGKVDGSYTPYPQEPYLVGGTEKPMYGNLREGENPAATGYPYGGYPPSGPSFGSGKPGKEKKQDSTDGPHTAYPHESFPEGSTYRPAYAYSAAGERPDAGYQVAAYPPAQTSFEAGKTHKEKEQDKFDGSYTGRSPTVAYPPAGYPTSQTPVELGKSAKGKKQGGFDGPPQTGYPQEPYAPGSFYSAPDTYPVPGGQYGSMHDEGKQGKNKEENKHNSFDSHDKHSAYPQAPYQGTPFPHAPSGYHVSGDQHGKKHDGSKLGKDKGEKKYGSFDDHHDLHTGYPPTPYMGGSTHHTPGGYPVSGDHHGGKHGKYKEEKHGKHAKHGKHGNFKGY